MPKLSSPQHATVLSDLSAQVWDPPKLGPPTFTWANVGRSEEHTSELQSHSDIVCRLLLEKKNTRNWNTSINHINSNASIESAGDNSLLMHIHSFRQCNYI